MIFLILNTDYQRMMSLILNTDYHEMMSLILLIILTISRLGIPVHYKLETSKN